MGMSASQARLIQLQARQSNLEYQGQQINQERTILSQQCTDLYNSLLGMTVPTPPSTSDFTTIEYSGSYGASKFSLGSIVPTGNTYTVNLNYERVGNAVYSAGKATITDTKAKIPARKLDESETQPRTVDVAKTEGKITSGTTLSDIGNKKILHKTTKDKLSEYPGANVYKFENGSHIKLSAEELETLNNNAEVFVLIDATKKDESGNDVPQFAEGDYIYGGTDEQKTITPGISSSDIINFYVADSEGGKCHKATYADFTYDKDTQTYQFKTGKTYYKYDTSSKESIDNPDYIEGGINISLNGNALLDWNTAIKNYNLSDEDQKSYVESIKNGFPEYSNLEDDELMEKFYVSFSTEGSTIVPHFTLKQDVQTAQTNGADSKWASYYDITTTGKFTEIKTEENCQLTFDTAGRIVEIAIPTVNPDTGEVVYTSVKLEAKTITDEAAYQDAYNEYEYATYEYDKKQQEINAKTEIIQQEDRNLELKLQRLDNERQQITTEIEAVQKVIDDNIEASYKTFSG